MSKDLFFLGDINLLGADGPDVPFACVADRLAEADLVFANLECCLYDPPSDRSDEQEGFYAEERLAGALSAASVGVAGCANNVTYGAPAIRRSLATLDRIEILRTGAGATREEAEAPAIADLGSFRVGVLQRTSIYWPTDHEAGPQSSGVAVMRAHTAFRPVLEFNGLATRAGVPPEVITWTDPAYLERYLEQVAALRERCDFLAVSHHWGYREDVLAYQTEIAHAAINAGADLVLGHGPHTILPVEVYRGRPIFYGVGSFCFKRGHRRRVHGDWLGLAVRVGVADDGALRVAAIPVRQTAKHQTVFLSTEDEPDAMGVLVARSRDEFQTGISIESGEIVVPLAGRTGEN